MFEDCLIESTRHIAKRRGLTTLLSTSMQMLVLMLLVIFPLLRTNVLSPQHLTQIFAPAPISAPPLQGNHQPSGMTDSGRAMPMPVQVPTFNGSYRIRHYSDPVGPPPQGLPICTHDCGTIPGGIPGGTNLLAMPTLATKPVGPLHLSNLVPGQIIRRVQPAYPHLATVTRTQGAVVLHAIISREGTIEQLQVLSGHPLLDQAALDAVKQWRFRPYILNGQPIEVETEITVNFILGGG